MRMLLLGRVSRDHQAALWYSLIRPLTVVRRLIGAAMPMASPVVCRRVKGSASVAVLLWGSGRFRAS